MRILGDGRQTMEMAEQDSEVLNDPKCLDIRYFIENYIILERNKSFKIELWQRRILDAVYPVEGESLYSEIMLGMPRKSGKTSFLAAIILFEVLFSSEACPDPEIYSISRDEDQAKIILRSVEKMVRRAPKLKEILYLTKKTVECPARGSLFKALSADVDSSYGLNPSMTVLDEFSTSDWSLWVSLITGMGQRAADGQPIKSFAIGTAGHDLNSQFYKWFQQCEKGEQPDTYFYWSNTMESSFNQNPRYEKFLAKQKTILRPEEFERFHRNKWVRGAGSFITEADYEAIVDPSLVKDPAAERYCYLGVDVGTRSDCGAITAIGFDAEGREGHYELLSHQLFRPEDYQSGEVLIEDIENCVREYCDSFSVLGVAYDRYQFLRSVQLLKAELDCEFIEIAQSESKLAEISGQLYSAVKSKSFKVYPDEELKEHFLNADVKETSRGGWRLIKSKKQNKIDLAIAAAMALSLAILDPSGAEGAVMSGPEMIRGGSWGGIY